MPIRLQVENTNRCNLSCIMCAREFREVFSKDMPQLEFEKLVREVRPAYLTLNGDGEPLLDRGIFDKIRFAKARCFSVDANQGLRMGNAFDEGFRNVWRGEKYRSLRSRMLTKKRAVPICATCTVADDDLHRRFRKWMAWLPVPFYYKWKNA